MASSSNHLFVTLYVHTQHGSVSVRSLVVFLLYYHNYNILDHHRRLSELRITQIHGEGPWNYLQLSPNYLNMSCRFIKSHNIYMGGVIADLH